MAFPEMFLKFLVYGALLATTVGTVALLSLWAKDWLGGRLW